VDLGRTSNGGEMLVLTRKTNQSIMIGDDIEVSVLAVSRDKIRLGITAPRDVPVFRKEVYLSIKGEEAAEAAGDDTEPARKKVDDALDGLTKGE
jgi:carbon storage regulator